MLIFYYEEVSFVNIINDDFQSSVFSRPVVFNDDGKFGLKDENGNIVVKAEYKKLIRLGESGWIIQKGSKFGIMNDEGKILVEPKYNRADRVLGKFAKLTKGEKTDCLMKRVRNSSSRIFIN